MRPLEGIRVLGVEQYMSAPYCTMLLADAGAEVIKIERPGTGDPRRSIGPFAGTGETKVAGGFMAYNRNKKSLTLDLASEDGRAVFRRLVEKSDVVVENLRPGSMERRGLGYGDLRAINERLIYAAISGFGRLDGYEGPYSDRPAFDIVAEAMSGVMNLVGFDDKPPSWTIYGLADIYSGLCASNGVLQALFQRERTGLGQFVDSAMLDNMISLNERMVMLYSLTGEEPKRGQLRHLYPRGAYKCRDGYLAINVPDNLIWSRLCQVIDREDLIEDNRCSDGSARAANSAFVDDVINTWLAERTRGEAEELLNARGVPVGPVYGAADVFSDPHVAVRRSLVEVQDPDAGPQIFARSPVMLSGSPEIETRAAPRLGEHNHEVLSDLLGYDETEIRRLEASSVI